MSSALALAVAQNLRLPIGQLDPRQPGMVLPTVSFSQLIQQIANAATNAPPITVAQLPPVQPCLRAFVTDANATTFNSIVAGGGANFVPVFCDGTNWRIG